MALSRLSVSARFLLVLAIGFTVQAGISLESLINLRQQLLADRASEVKHLDEAAYSIVASYYDRASKGLMSDVAAQKAARDDVRAMRFDGTNYYFIWDQDGTGVAHGSHAEFEGENLINSPEATRLPYVADMVRKLVAVGHTAGGEGYTSYRMSKPGGSVPLDKIAYNRLFAPWGWNIGTGAYFDDIDAAFWKQARTDLLIMVGLIALAAIASVVLARDFSIAIGRLSRRVERVAAGELDGEVPGTDRGDEVGMLARALVVLRDTSSLATILEGRVSERTRQLQEAQEELVKSERLSTMGQLTATVAHELRNPLSAIKNTTFALREMASGQALPFDRPIARIERSVDRCTQIVSDLLDFTRTTKPKLHTIRADRWLGKVLDEIAVPDGIVLERRLDAPQSRVAIDSDRFRRVLINLVDNAAQAMEGSGSGEGRIIVSTSASPAFEIVVEDNGPGISPDVLPKVFEPLFSTKSFGTGLGLPTVKQIVEQHGGSIEITSRPDRGTRVVVRLPDQAKDKLAA